MQMPITANKPICLTGYTLFETLFVLTITLGLFLSPSLSVSAWQKQMTIEQFFAQFESRIYATQKIAIVSQQAIRIFYDQSKNQIVFDVPNPNLGWSTLEVPDEITVQQMEKLISLREPAMKVHCKPIGSIGQIKDKQSFINFS